MSERIPKTEAEAKELALRIGRLQKALVHQKAEARIWKKNVRETRTMMSDCVEAIIHYCRANRLDSYQFIAEILGMPPRPRPNLRVIPARGCRARNPGSAEPTKEHLA